MWGRRKSAGSAAPARLPVSRAEWRSLPPIQRAVPEHPLVNPVRRFSDSLVAWQSPAYLAPLGHRISTAEPSGVADLARPVAASRAVDMPVAATPPRKPRRGPILSRIFAQRVEESVSAGPGWRVGPEGQPGPEWQLEAERHREPEGQVEPEGHRELERQLEAERRREPAWQREVERQPEPEGHREVERQVGPELHREPEGQPGGVGAGGSSADEALRAGPGLQAEPGFGDSPGAEADEPLVSSGFEVTSGSRAPLRDEPAARPAASVARSLPTVQRIARPGQASTPARSAKTAPPVASTSALAANTVPPVANTPALAADTPLEGANTAPPVANTAPLAANMGAPRFTKAATVELPTVAQRTSRETDPSPVARTRDAAPPPVPGTPDIDMATGGRRDVEPVPETSEVVVGAAEVGPPVAPVPGGPGVEGEEASAPLVGEPGSRDLVEPGVAAAVPGLPVAGAPAGKPVVSRQVEASPVTPWTGSPESPRRLGLGAPRIPSARPNPPAQPTPSVQRLTSEPPEPMPVPRPPAPDIPAGTAPLAGALPMEPGRRLEEPLAPIRTPSVAESPTPPPVAELPVARTLPDPVAPIQTTVATTVSRLIGDRTPITSRLDPPLAFAERPQAHRSTLERPPQAVAQRNSAAPRWAPPPETVSFVQRAESEAPAEAAAPDTPVTEPASEPRTPPDQAAPTQTVPAQTAAPQAEQNPDELVKKLYDPLLRRLKTELRLDRERRGVLTDRRH
jgi:hypothetical protein